ncbi:phosphate ABC transporter membrane protein 1 (PhoT family) [Halanaerobium saccharolyticum]|uniref:Phosphate transport system permease protein n=1 Tax=Halanaerobium saccharolyticum TaxID=43595 RepID=A0A4R7YTY9_9FIRM|nr:phosphate ABC transporter permease subunit PstC [Halanaerobium saccharolyticum]RAK06629.1 phosphate ABC transporter membrane protein 1 (PhoT family) [Halanaerobium saccharolyticum]TDW01168.1 phosphate ABC transporter membrane protein 1 (PhoT family) [Halanaerobium saccharolyticum]TDX51219.1 phosphate ABC transporter membrane protein 1 (PhoT family) [Halanaerobium saccharolyticum]
MLNWTTKEKIIKNILMLFAFSSILFLTGIIIVLFREGAPIFTKVGISEFLFSSDWYPTYDPPGYGIFNLLSASIVVTIGAMVIAVPFGVASAVHISYILPKKYKNIVKPTIEMLAGVPSVIYGLFGMKILSPFLRGVFGLPTGLTALTAMIMLGIMSLPTIVSLSEDAITAVPKSFRDASLALGANRLETMIRVILPTASSGIVTAIILGMGRAIGETMTVLMVAGGASLFPSNILKPVRPMTATIAAEMGEAPVGSEHYQALFGIAIILFLITLVFNIFADIAQQRFKEKVSGE